MEQTYPLESMTEEESKKMQFRLIDCITRNFNGQEMLNQGDLGVVKGLNKPLTTQKAERALAEFFRAEACMLVRGAGSGAIRLGLHSLLKCGDEVLVHDAPVYPTTQTSLNMMGLTAVRADFNDLGEIKRALQENPQVKAAVVQYTRQQPHDCYNMAEVIAAIKEQKNIPVLTDDNYAVMKVRHIGIQCGADLSCFSAFKLLGPEGIGIIVGREKWISALMAENYSGGMQVQGHEALAVLRGLTYAPVALAVQAQVNEECIKRLKAGEIAEVKDAFLANAQSKVLLVEFRENIAEEVLAEAQKLGAAPHPVGSESKYELVPMFYRISATFRQSDLSLEQRMIRINPMRGGADTIMRILKESIERVKKCF